MSLPVKLDTKQVFFDTPSFTMARAYSSLKKLAKSAPDLTQNDLLTPHRLEKMQAVGAGFTLLYGFQRVDEGITKLLFELANQREALAQMQAMQAGKIVNFIDGVESENRSVLHTAMRDVFGSSRSNEASQNAERELKKLESFIQTIDTEKRFSELILIGIGGSELGPKALYNGLSFYQRKDRSVHFIGNIDPDDVALTLRHADLSKSLVVVVSKSGTTLETATNEEFMRAEFVKLGLKPEKHFVSVTMPKTPMDNKKRYLECFYMWDYVGGRYSATSMVGGLLLSFGVGFKEFMELLKGAHEMDEVALKADPRENLPLLGALLNIWNRNFLEYATVAVIPYAQVLHRFPAHLQQCDMESNGKRIDRHGKVCAFETGPVVWGEPGTNAQHSFYQLIHQGTSVVPVEMIGFVESQGNSDFEWQGTTSQEKLLSNMFAQALALACGQKSSNPNKTFPGNRPSSILLAKKLTPYALGALLAYYEHKVAFQGFIWGINSFDQEGVQLGKVLADRMIKLFKAKRSRTTTEEFPLGQALLNIIGTI